MEIHVLAAISPAIKELDVLARKLKDLKLNKGHLIAGSTGGATGAWLGSSIGIVGLGSAITGIVPCAFIGAYVSWRGYQFAKSKISKQKETEQ